MNVSCVHLKTGQVSGNVQVQDPSVTAQGQKDADITNASVDDVIEISQEEALEKASTLLEHCACIYMGENAVWTAKQIEYMRNEKQMLGTGIVNYIFVTDADACVISYNCTQQYFYQIRQFSKDELDSCLSDEKEQGALRSLEQIIADVK